MQLCVSMGDYAWLCVALCAAVCQRVAMGIGGYV